MINFSSEFFLIDIKNSSVFKHRFVHATKS